MSHGAYMSGEIKIGNYSFALITEVSHFVTSFGRIIWTKTIGESPREREME